MRRAHGKSRLSYVANAGTVVLAMVAMSWPGAVWASELFVKPTAEELSMKELPGYAGVPAVVLYREEVAKDDLHMVQHYDRVKILTEEGKRYANVELKFLRFSDFGNNDYTDDKTIGEISGRTIHTDGTVVPFTGKPYRKTMEKTKNVRSEALVFTLPDVEVGSIIEYRYSTRVNIDAYESPDWFVQGDLYVKSAHYEWYPTAMGLVDSKERPITSRSWFAMLPPGAKIEKVERMTPGAAVGKTNTYVLDVKDVPPVVEEELAPPMQSVSYRVLFNFSAYKSAEDFWKSEGKDWSKRVDAFADPNSALRGETERVVAGATTPEEKLRKLYAAVMKLENTRFTRQHDEREDKAEGDKIKSAGDVLSHGRGSPTQLTELFLGMARASGMKAYAMLVPDRSIELFKPTWLSFSQFDDLLAVVELDGKEICFDPGSRYVPYGHMAWQHTLVNGLRQTADGTAFAVTGGETYKDNRTTRVANLTMDDQGKVTGKIDMTYTGSEAVEWRHRGLRGDDESLHTALRKDMEEALPKTLDVEVGQIGNLDDYEKPLVVSYTVTGMMGTVTGKRVFLPADMFTVGEGTTFPHEKRVYPVYFEYPFAMQDAVKITLPQGMSIEASPEAAQLSVPNRQIYDMSITTTPTSLMTRRTHVEAEAIVPLKDYDSLRRFYGQMESKDQAKVVLKPAVAETASGAALSGR